MHRHPRALPILVATLALSTVGCSALDGTNESHTRGRAERIGAVLEQRRISSVPQLLHWATGDNPGYYESVALVADDDGADQRLVLRITEVDETFATGSESWTACYAYRFDHWSFADGPDHVDCPDVPVIAPPPIPVPPSLDPGTLVSVRLAVEAMEPTQRADISLVRRTVEEALAGDADAVVSVARVDGSTGVAVSVHGATDCVMARTEPLEAWVPPSVLVQPGEIGCNASAAAQGAAQRPPH